MKMIGLILLVVIIGILFNSSFVKADNFQVIWQPNATNGTDTEIRSAQSTLNFSNLTANTWGDSPGNERRILLNWTFVKKSFIGQNITINTAKLLTYSSKGSNSLKALGIFPMKAEWEEINVTWDNCGGGGGSGCASHYNASWNLTINNGFEGLDSAGGIFFNYTMNITYWQSFFDGNLGVWDKGLILIGGVDDIDPESNIVTSDEVVNPERRIALWINYSNITQTQSNITMNLISPISGGFHNTTISFNFNISSLNNLPFNYSLYADTNTNPITIINQTNNTRGINATFIYKFLSEIGGSINGTYYWKINGSVNLTEVFQSLVYSFNITNNINQYNVTNVSITPIPLNGGVQAKCHFNLTNKNLQNDTINMSEILWFNNITEIASAKNNTFLNAPNVSLNSNISCQVRINVGFGETGWTSSINSSIVKINDTIPPILNNCSLQYASLTDTSGNINIFNCSSIDANSNIQSMSFDLNGTLNKTISFSFLKAQLVSASYSIFQSLETLIIGDYSIMNVTIADTSGNTLINSTNFHFSVTSAPSGNGGSSGGGGGGLPPQIIINQTNLTSPIQNCNFNKICEPMEDPFGCSSDCRINTDYLFCENPSKKCIKDTISETFDLLNARNPVFRISIILLIISIIFIFVPIESEIGKIFKQPFIRKR